MEKKLTGAEMDAAREAKKAYYREWRRKNRERIKATNERYWLRKAQEMAMAAPDPAV